MFVLLFKNISHKLQLTMKIIFFVTLNFQIEPFSSFYNVNGKNQNRLVNALGMSI